MLWKADYVGEKFTVTVQWIVDLLKRVLGDVFDFIAAEEGWDAE